MPYTKLRTWYKMVTANSGKFSSVSCKIFPSNAGEPSRSTFDAQSLLFWLRSRHDCRNTIISFVLLSFGTIWAAKHRTKVHHCANTSRWPSIRSSETYDLYWCWSYREITWRYVTCENSLHARISTTVLDQADTKRGVNITISEWFGAKSTNHLENPPRNRLRRAESLCHIGAQPSQPKLFTRMSEINQQRRENRLEVSLCT